jgi:integrase
MQGISTSVVLDTRIICKDGTHSVKLRLTFYRKQKYYPTGYYLTKEDWNETQSLKPRGEYKEQSLYFNKFETKAINIIKSLDDFSFELFEEAFNSKPKEKFNVLEYFDDYIDNLLKEERIGTADSYKCAKNSFQKYLKDSKKNKIEFADITPDWLRSYEKWMLKQGKSITTVGIYTRSLKAIFNIAIENGIIGKEQYPFGKRKFKTPASQNIKKALTLPEIKLIANYKAKNKEEQKAIDFWMFTYLCSGINVKDIIRLQYKNISKKSITFLRAKTERSSRSNLKNVSVAILPESEVILKRWGQKDKNPENYVFGFLDGKETPQQERAKIRQVTKTINLHTKRLGIALGFDLKLTTYSARHSFATVLKRSGAPIEYISESLGHKDLRTTENYLDSFEDETRLETQKKLLDFG